MKCKLVELCKFTDLCNMEVCKYYQGEIHQVEPKKRSYVKRAYRKTAKRAEKAEEAQRELDPANDGDLIVARRILMKNSDTLSAENVAILKTLTGRHVKNFNAEERRTLIDAAQSTIE